MGRPPIGKVAMTSTERSRRRRAGLAANSAATKPVEPATKPQGKPERDPPGPDPAALAQAKARIIELERALAQANALERALAQAKARLKAAGDDIAALEKARGRKFILKRADYRLLLKCLHPDRIAGVVMRATKADK